MTLISTIVDLNEKWGWQVATFHCFIRSHHLSRKPKLFSKPNPKLKNHCMSSCRDLRHKLAFEATTLYVLLLGSLLVSHAQVALLCQDLSFSHL